MISDRMAGVWFTIAIVGLLLVPGVAQAQVGEQVEKLTSQAGEAAKDAAAKWMDQIRSDPWTWLHSLAAVGVLIGLWMLKVIRPDSLEQGGPRRVDGHPPFIWIASGALAFLAMVAGGVMATTLLHVQPGSSGLRERALLSLSNYALSIPATVVLVRLLGMSAPEAGLSVRPPDFTKGLLAIALAWPVVQASAIVTAWLMVKFGGPAPEDIAHSTLAALQKDARDPWALTLGACAVLGAPIVEEFIFRGCLQSAILKLFGRPWVAVVATSAAFAAMHLSEARGGTWHAIAALFVLGVALGVAFERTRSFLVPVVMHVVFNLANILITLAKL